MKTNQDYKNAALAALKGHWTPAVLLTLLIFVISLIPTFLAESDSTLVLLLSAAITFCVMVPLSVGIYAAFRMLLNSGDSNLINNSFKVGFGNWGHHVGGMLLMTVYVFLWTLLLIIPGLIKSFSYALTPFILADKPELSANEAIELSMKMMDGHKLDLLILYLSFIGWYILAFFTFCIGMLWLAPYVYTTMAAFYEDVKAEYESKAVAA